MRLREICRLARPTWTAFEALTCEGRRLFAWASDLLFPQLGAFADVVPAYLIQYLSGNGLSGYSTYFFEQAGLSATDSFDLTMAQYAIGLVGTVLSWFLMARSGRRTLYLIGMVLSSILLMTIGFLGLAPLNNKAIDWAKGGLLLAFFCVHSCFIGPVSSLSIASGISANVAQRFFMLSSARSPQQGSARSPSSSQPAHGACLAW